MEPFVMDIDRSLDDLITEKKKRNRAKNQHRGRQCRNDWKGFRGQYKNRKRHRSPPCPGYVMVHNLHPQVDSKELKIVFEVFGPIDMCTVHYNLYKKSLGMAHIIFKFRKHAENAIHQYNGGKHCGNMMFLKEPSYTEKNVLESYFFSKRRHDQKIQLERQRDRVDDRWSSDDN
ncbi:uncharacterized protein LOC119674361 [Teleopsis dalmanni]|uniref:uncharacterized protein LOC119674361 n=1 Tax=Teleopsis dalmanni TaxID=139649 RepID=UPI0018CCAEF2|nr:uncharacterized protein LOC119674361 [Teleopsis dalmanni]